MGLSLHIHAHAPASLNIAGARALVTRWHAVAESIAAEGRLDHVHEISDEAADLDQFATAWLSMPHPTEPDTITGVAVTPLEGVIFLVEPGDGCEPLALGLCRYPANVKNSVTGNEPPLPTGHADDWRLLSSCKTQYASLAGWENFRRCHLALVDLAVAGQALGVDVRIEDEGGYWPGHDETFLRANLERLNRLTAGLAGALKDATDVENPRIASVQAPIFGHPHFERLEAEALDGPDAQKIADAQKTIHKAKP